jgi:phosphoribosylformylglycinamidine synthase
VSGNVSLYNATGADPILPTPAIGAVGLIEDATKTARIAFPDPGLTILLVGDNTGEIGQSIYLREIHGIEKGAPPEVDLKIERRNGDFVRGLITSAAALACHDVSDGGLLVALAEMAMAGGIGATLELPADPAILFGEAQARYIVVTATPEFVLSKAGAASVPVSRLGVTGGAAFVLNGESIDVAALKSTHEDWLPGYMAGRD